MPDQLLPVLLSSLMVMVSMLHNTHAHNVISVCRLDFNILPHVIIINYNYVCDSDEVALVPSLFTGFVNDLLKIEYV